MVALVVRSLVWWVAVVGWWMEVVVWRGVWRFDGGWWSGGVVEWWRPVVGYARRGGGAVGQWGEDWAESGDWAHW